MTAPPSEPTLDLMALHEKQVEVAAAFKEALGTVSPPVERVLRFFEFEHLPPALRAVSVRFCELAVVVATSSSNAETTVALRKLLESKDAAVRAVL